MSFRKHGLKVLGLSVMAALSLMAFSVSVVQGAWLENGATITGLKNAKGEIDTLGILEVPALNSKIDCTAFKVNPGVILGSAEASEPNIAHVGLLYEGCKGYTTSGGTLTLQSKCLLFETQVDRNALTNAGNILATALFEIITHNGAKYIKVTAHSKIWSEECVNIPNGTLVTGNFVMQLGAASVTKQLVSVSDLALFPNNLKFGINEAKLQGTVWVELESSNPWGIC